MPNRDKSSETPLPSVQADLYREEILRTRAMSPHEKILEGLWLFDHGCKSLEDIVRSHFPHAGEAGVRAIVDRAVRLIH